MAGEANSPGLPGFAGRSGGLVDSGFTPSAKGCFCRLLASLERKIFETGGPAVEGAHTHLLQPVILEIAADGKHFGHAVADRRA